jgi:hypothetical protein
LVIVLAPGKEILGPDTLGKRAPTLQVVGEEDIHESRLVTQEDGIVDHGLLKRCKCHPSDERSVKHKETVVKVPLREHLIPIPTQESGGCLGVRLQVQLPFEAAAIVVGICVVGCQELPLPRKIEKGLDSIKDSEPGIQKDNPIPLLKVGRKDLELVPLVQFAIVPIVGHGLDRMVFPLLEKGIGVQMGDLSDANSPKRGWLESDGKKHDISLPLAVDLELANGSLRF